MADPVADYLKSLNTSDAVRAAAWDAAHAGDDAHAEDALKALPFSDAVKADLWDLRSGHAVKPHAQATATTEAFLPPPSIMQRIGTAAAAMNGPAQPDDVAAAEKQATGDIALGAAKGLGNTAIGLGQAAYNHVPGVGRLSDAVNGQPAGDAFRAARATMTTPTNDAQKLGFGTEQAAEFLVPAEGGERLAATIAGRLTKNGVTPVLARMASRAPVNAAINATVAGSQGGNATAAAELGAALPVASEAASKGVETLGPLARGFVRSAIKPTVAAMRQQPGASMTGIDAQANKLVRFILDNEITSADKAQAIINDAEAEVQRLVGNAQGVTTDAPQRAQRYLDALERSAARQGLPGKDVATIRSAMSELLDKSKLSTTVMQPVTIPSPSGLVDQYGKPVMVASHQPTRVFRTDVSPTEALETARSSGKWGNRKVWGEMKGAETEASKAVERASRDAVKVAIPETREPLQREGQAITAKNVFDRMAFREGNREPVSPFDVTTAAVEIGQGRPPVMALGRAFLRENKVRMGMWAQRLERALSQNDAKAATEILARFGIGEAAQPQRPELAPSH